MRGCAQIEIFAPLPCLCLLICGVCFFLTKTAKKPVPPSQAEESHWTELYRVLENYWSAVCGHGQLLSLPSWLPSPSFSPWADPHENRNQPKLVSVFRSFNHNPLFLSFGIMLELVRVVIYVYFYKKLLIWSSFQLPAQGGLQIPSSLKALPGWGR